MRAAAFDWGHTGIIPDGFGFDPFTPMQLHLSTINPG